jgi:hypothetical protein
MPRPYLMAVLLALPLSASAQDVRTVSTTGEAVIYVTPDEVIVHVGVETFDRDLARSKALNDSLSQALVAAVRALGIEQRHIQTADVEVEIRYHNRAVPALEIEGYIARRAYSVTLKDVDRFETLVDSAIAHGANRLMGFEYRTTELRRHRDEARRMAARAAREKAELLAVELGGTIGRPRTINEGGIAYFGYTSSRWGTTSGWMSQNSVQMVQPSAEGGETMPLGQIGIRASVNAVFDLGG